MMHKFKKGFTLAEVLITLLIIGVIASIVIPGLINDTQDQQYKVTWKKVYSDLNQATKRIMLDNGGTIKGLCSTDDQICFRDKYLQYLNSIKTCTGTTIAGNCWHTTETPNTNSTILGDDSGAVLNNGVFLTFDWDSGDCSINYGIPNTCGKMVIDVNGFKGPNVAGKDIFGVWLLGNVLVPTGRNDGYTCNSGVGVGCSAPYLTQ